MTSKNFSLVALALVTSIFLFWANLSFAATSKSSQSILLKKYIGCISKKKNASERTPLIQKFKRVVPKGPIVIDNTCQIKVGSIKATSLKVDQKSKGSAKSTSPSTSLLAVGTGPCVTILNGDTNHDGRVDFVDLVAVSSNYGKLRNELSNPNIDVTEDGVVNFADLLMVSQFYGLQRCTAPVSSFTVYDAVGGFINKPASFIPSATAIVVNGQNMYRQTAAGLDLTRYDEAATRAYARLLTPGKPIVLDLENPNFPIDIRRAPRAVVDHTVSSIIELIGWIKSEQPTSPIGVYSGFPISDATVYVEQESIQSIIDANRGDDQYYWALNAIIQANDNLVQLQQANDVLLPLARKVDEFFPSLYVDSDNPIAFGFFAKGTLKEARRHNLGKKVLPFVWPRCHNSSQTCAWQLLPNATMSAAYHSLKQYGADGVTIWDDGRGQPWQQFGWLTELVLFLATL